jgi:TPR repeat protein
MTLRYRMVLFGAVLLLGSTGCGGAAATRQPPEDVAVEPSSAPSPEPSAGEDVVVEEDAPPPPPEGPPPAAPEGPTPYQEQIRITGEEYGKCMMEPVAQCEARCKEGDTPACREVGWRYTAGMNATADPKRAEYYLYEACKKNDGKACDYLASFYAGMGPVNKRDQKKADKYRQKACDNDWAAACYALGGIHLAHQRKEQAIAHFKKACELGLQQACTAAAD